MAPIPLQKLKPGAEPGREHMAVTNPSPGSGAKHWPEQTSWSCSLSGREGRGGETGQARVGLG